MSGHKDNEQILAERIALMGTSLGQLTHRLEAELTNLVGRWQQYRILYGSDPGHIDILNRAAGYFFADLQSILWEDVLLGIARLTENNRHVVSIKRIPPMISDVAFKKRLEYLLKEVYKECAFAADWRNRQIAHRDRNLAFEKASHPLQEASRAHVERALATIGKFLNAFAGHFEDAETMWSEVITPGDDARHLLHVLSDGIRADEAKRQRFLAGTYTREDIPYRGELWTPNEPEDS